MYMYMYSPISGMGGAHIPMTSTCVLCSSLHLATGSYHSLLLQLLLSLGPICSQLLLQLCDPREKNQSLVYL